MLASPVVYSISILLVGLGHTRDDILVPYCRPVMAFHGASWLVFLAANAVVVVTMAAVYIYAIRLVRKQSESPWWSV